MGPMIKHKVGKKEQNQSRNHLKYIYKNSERKRTLKSSFIPTPKLSFPGTMASL